VRIPTDGRPQATAHASDCAPLGGLAARRKDGIAAGRKKAGF
jgi:hypothetical protein